MKKLSMIERSAIQTALYVFDVMSVEEDYYDSNEELFQDADDLSRALNKFLHDTTALEVDKRNHERPLIGSIWASKSDRSYRITVLSSEGNVLFRDERDGTEASVPKYVFLDVFDCCDRY